MSAVIIALGLLAVLAVYLSPARQRARTAGRLQPGTDSSVVLRRLGNRPQRCPGADVDHVVAEFAAGTSRPERAEALARIRAGTRARWIYPGGHGCRPRAGDAEVGFDARGRVLWVAPAIGRVPLVYADTLAS
ncbi:MAG TPA: hypothetical protein VF771_08610 [Longimicrobiaceae bacterium]